MRTTAIRCPSTSKRRAEPGFTSSIEQSRTVLMRLHPPALSHDRARAPCRHLWLAPGPSSRPPVFELVDDRGAQPPRERREGQPREDVVEEAEHDQALRLFRRHTAALQVVQLLLVD